MIPTKNTIQKRLPTTRPGGCGVVVVPVMQAMRRQWSLDKEWNYFGSAPFDSLKNQSTMQPWPLRSFMGLKRVYAPNLNLTIITDDSCGFCAITIIHSEVRAVKEGSFISLTLNIVHCEGAIHWAKLRFNSRLPRSVPQHPEQIEAKIVMQTWCEATIKSNEKLHLCLYLMKPANNKGVVFAVKIITHR